MKHEYDDNAVTFDVLLRELRRDRGLSQDNLARLLHAVSDWRTLTRHETSRWERGVRVPDDFWLRWLAVVLQAPLARLLAARAASEAARRWRYTSGTVTTRVVEAIQGVSREWRESNEVRPGATLTDSQVDELSRVYRQTLMADALRSGVVLDGDEPGAIR